MNTILYKPIEELTATEHEQIREIVQPYYTDATQLLARALSHNTHVYLSYHNDMFVAFFMVAWETLSVNGTDRPALFLGLSSVDPEFRNKKLVSALYNQSMLDVAEWQANHSQELIVWFTTATPVVWHSISRIYRIIQPTIDSNYPPELADIGRAIQLCHYPYARPNPNPFVLKGVATATQYAVAERTYLEQTGQKNGPTIFDQLDVDESAGDRLLVLCALPDEESIRQQKRERLQESIAENQRVTNN